MEMIPRRIKEIKKEIIKIEKIISKKIGQDFSIADCDLMDGWIEEYFEKRLTQEQFNFIVKTLEEYFGKLDRPNVHQIYKKVQEGRYDNFKFFTYFNVKY